VSDESVSLKRPLVVALWSLLSAFGLLVALAMRAYPGGNWSERTAAGHRFWENYWCDLLGNPTVGGGANPSGSLLAALGMFCFGLGLLCHWWLLATLLPYRPRRWVRALGTLATLGFLVVVALPSSSFPVLHGAAVLCAGPLGIAAAIIAAVVQARDRAQRPLSWLAFAVLLASATNLVFYAHAYATSTPAWHALPAVQKVATALLVSWMLAESALVWLRAGRTPGRLGGPGAKAPGP